MTTTSTSSKSNRYRTRRSCSSGAVDSCVVRNLRDKTFSSSSLETSEVSRAIRKKSSLAATANTAELKAGDAVKEYRIVLLGAGKVGKSALIRRFLEHTFHDQYHPTVEDSYRHILQSPDGTCYVIEILDTSGVYAFPAMRELNIRQAGAFILVFSLDSPDSMEEVRTLHREILSIRGENSEVPVVLVGNKNDLNGSARRVPPETAASLSRDLKRRYMETSAESDDNIEQLFSLVIFRYLHVDARAKSIPPSSSSRIAAVHRKISGVGSGGCPRSINGKIIQKRHSDDGQMRLRVRPDGTMRQVFHSVDPNVSCQQGGGGGNQSIETTPVKGAHMVPRRMSSLAFFKQRSQSTTSNSDSVGRKSSLLDDQDLQQIATLPNTRDGNNCRRGDKCCFL